jgi:hypothetical protein
LLNWSARAAGATNAASATAQQSHRNKRMS